MSKVNMIIEEFYEKAAKELLRRKADKLPLDIRNMKVLRLNLKLMGVDIDIDKEYYSVMDSIDVAVLGKLDDNIYIDFYGDVSLFDTKINVESVIRKHTVRLLKLEKLHKSEKLEETEKALINDIKAKLIEKNPASRISELYYYKKSHRKYVQELEEAYIEIVKECTKEKSDNCFNKSTINKIQRLTQKIVGSAANYVYKTVYDKSIPEKYKPSKEEFINDINTNSALYVKSVNCLDFSQYGYYEEAIRKVKGLLHISIETSWNDYTYIAALINKKISCDTEKESVARSTYDIFFKNAFTNIAGFNYSEINNMCNYGLSERFILKDLSNDLNYILFALMRMADGNKKQYKDKFSRFIIISDMTEFGIVKEAINIYRQIIKGAISDEEQQNAIIRSCQDEEVKLFLNSDIKESLPELIDNYIEKLKIEIENSEISEK
ncbi:MAG: hypothetical protein ACI4KR_10200 [Ruminiclostridium sp.]